MTKITVADEKLGVLARRQNDLFRRVREGSLPVEDVLKGLQSLIEGNFDAVPAGLNKLIDCDAAPWCPDGSKVESHQKGGQLEFDPDKIELYLCDEQKHGFIEGNELRLKLEYKPTLNACVLDHLLANTNLIPESWKYDERGRTRYIYFWGTKYRCSGGSLFVRCLCWRGSGWGWDDDWLGYEFDGRGPAAVLAS